MVDQAAGRSETTSYGAERGIWWISSSENSRLVSLQGQKRVVCSVYLMKRSLLHWYCTVKQHTQFELWDIKCEICQNYKLQLICINHFLIGHMWADCNMMWQMRPPLFVQVWVRILKLFNAAGLSVSLRMTQLGLSATVHRMCLNLIQYQIKSYFNPPDPDFYFDPPQIHT